MAEPVVEVVGVYDADGGVVGELTYVVGHLLGRTECSLCDVTHGPVRRKPDWDAMAARLPVVVRLVHRNETTGSERAAHDATGLPVVLGVRADGGHTVLLGPAALRALEGSVAAFETALRAALAVEGGAPGSPRR
ncbi:hypothetical protein GCM10023168_34950 [Fodinibacter luteus]|uniref:Uncharacterized protein n=1 Tax=Fodinibacter luteus TaxID=552064 RepID=A0ABP8KQU1_9MICO